MMGDRLLLHTKKNDEEPCRLYNCNYIDLHITFLILLYRFKTPLSKNIIGKIILYLSALYDGIIKYDVMFIMFEIN